MLRVLHVNQSDHTGGAARAAHRLHLGMRRIGIDSRMAVIRRTGDDPHVHCPLGLRGRLVCGAHQRAAELLLRGQRSPEHPFRSLNLFPSGLATWINRSDADIVNLHWIGNETLSITEIAAIDRPIVWTMHDMWPFSGTEHYVDLTAPDDRGAGHGGLDLDRWIRRRKGRAWRNRTFHLASPSRWLADCALRSPLFSRMPCRVLPNGVDLTRFKPMDRDAARELLDLPSDRRFILFGALSSTSDRRKGFHFLQPALSWIAAAGRADGVEVLIFGASTPEEAPDFGLPTRYLGHFSDDVSLSVLYSAADVFVAPSLQDNLPNTLVESLATGTPCVAFDIGGMADLVDHGHTGYLAQPFRVEDLATGINAVLQGDAAALRRACRQKAERCYGDTTAAARYLEYYQELLETGAACD